MNVFKPTEDVLRFTEGLAIAFVTGGLITMGNTQSYMGLVYLAMGIVFLLYDVWGLKQLDKQKGELDGMVKNHELKKKNETNKDE